METFLFSLYVIVTVGILLTPSFVDLSRGRMFGLAILPPVLLAICFGVWSLVRALFCHGIDLEVINKTLFIMFFTFVFGTIMTLPILLISAFIVAYGRRYCRLNVMQSAVIGASAGALLVGAVWQARAFVWMAWISGFAAVWVQYYLTEYRLR